MLPSESDEGALEWTDQATSRGALGSAQRLSSSPSARQSLDLLTTLFVDTLGILKVTSWPAFSFTPANLPFSSLSSLGNELLLAL